MNEHLALAHAEPELRARLVDAGRVHDPAAHAQAPLESVTEVGADEEARAESTAAWGW